MLDNTALYWMIFGFALILLDISFLPGIGALFAGLGAITTYILLETSIIQHHQLLEIIVFLIASTAWAGVLWLPMKWLTLGPKTSYSNMIGTNAIVSEEDLTVGITGNVKWSGVTMKAELQGEQGEVAKVGESVVISSIKGNTVSVNKIKESK